MAEKGVKKAGKPSTSAGGFDHGELFKLEGKVPPHWAVPYGVQHILAMFVANLRCV